MIVADLQAMRHPFEPCTCGSSDTEHDHVILSISRGGNWKVNIHSFTWAGTAKLGLWWRTFGSSSARYLPSCSPGKAVDLAESLAAKPRRVLIEGPTLERARALAA